eukprot:GFUD01031152.1.p1 GENE.GFUD01031152.1~~GFUD01031152.1.p1  ORF type:complete len:1217 (+),score=283.27 GFUD01031152.1:87-3737(+)
MSDEIEFWLNGSLSDTVFCDPGQTLLQYLRTNLELKGTKSNCDEGCTGACTVLVSKWCPRLAAYEHRAMSSCRLPLGALHKTHITTVEGVGSSKNPHPIQERLFECHSVQCGYDTPGLVVAAYSLLVQAKTITIQDIVKNLDGVFSRCNGYRSVVEALQSFEGTTNTEREKLEGSFSEKMKTAPKYPLVFKGKMTSWTTVNNFEDAKQLLTANTKLFYGIPNNKKLTNSVVSITNDGSIVVNDTGILVDSNCTITNIVEYLKTKVSGLDEPKQEFVQKLLSIFHNIRSTQFRNSTSIGDALDECVELSLLHATLCSTDGRMKMFLADEKIKKSISIPWISNNNKFGFEKVSNRRGNSHAVVCAAMKLQMNGTSITKMSLFVSCETKKIKEAKETASTMVKNDEKKTEEIKVSLEKDVGSGEDCLLLANLVQKIVSKIKNNGRDEAPTVDKIMSTQFQEFVVGLSKDDIEPIGKPFPHAAGLLCATGEAVFVDDMPSYRNELFMEFVTSTRAHAKIKKVDASKALAVAGVKHFIGYKDIPEGKNLFATVGSEDEIIFAEDHVLYEGQPIGAILATNENIAKRAAMLVAIDYEDLDILVTIDDAIEAKSFFPVAGHFPFKNGEPEEAFAESEYVIEGSFETPRQEHFYEETLSMLVVPVNENGEMKVYCPTPNAFMTQTGIANLLSIPANRVTVIVKRIGCNYGGKAIRGLPYAYAVALAAHISGKPVRSVLTRTQDIQWTGQRGEFRGKYKVGVTDGKLTGVDYMLYKNGGYNTDASPDILTCALVHIDNCYKFPTFHGTGQVVKTNTPSNTAFRAYGAPPAFAITENMMFDVATELKLDPIEFRRNNFYKDGDTTHFGQVLKEDDVTMEACMDECITRADYYKEKELIEEFNKKNKTKKKGISLIPFNYGVGIPPSFGQGGALLNVNIDGSIIIFVGGVEMGQGFYTKMLQIASQELGIPMTKIHISESSTDNVPNPHISGGSSTADFSGNAVKVACQELSKRLSPFKEAEPKAPWEQWIGMAFGSRVCLSVASFYASPAEYTQYSLDEKKGNRWTYFVNGASCSIVEVDILTGEHKLLKTQIVMDVGESINPAIDVGQIEGSYVQGYGYLAMEETLFSKEGKLLSRGHDTYSAPTILDIPPVFNVALLRKATPVENRRLLYSSKGVGEPPFLSGASAFFAIKSAVVAARADRGVEGVCKLATPSTPRNVVQAIYL